MDVLQREHHIPLRGDGVTSDASGASIIRNSI